jgi:hypothetical protein
LISLVPIWRNVDTITDLRIKPIPQRSDLQQIIVSPDMHEAILSHARLLTDRTDLSLAKIASRGGQNYSFSL